MPLLYYSRTQNDYIQNPNYVYILLLITQFTTQDASCYSYSVFYFALRMCFSNQSVLSYNVHEPLFLQHILHNKHKISPSFVLPKINLIIYKLCRYSTYSIFSRMLYYLFCLKGISAVT